MENNHYNYSGCDVSLEISLEKYGFAYSLEDPRAKGALRVVYACQGGYGWADFNPALNFWREFDWIKAEGFLSYLGLTREEFDEMPLWRKIYDAIGYYGSENICGSEYYPAKNWRELINA